MSNWREVGETGGAWGDLRVQILEVARHGGGGLVLQPLHRLDGRWSGEGRALEGHGGRVSEKGQEAKGSWLQPHRATGGRGRQARSLPLRSMAATSRQQRRWDGSVREKRPGRAVEPRGLPDLSGQLFLRPDRPPTARCWDGLDLAPWHTPRGACTLAEQLGVGRAGRDDVDRDLSGSRLLGQVVDSRPATLAATAAE